MMGLWVMQKKSKGIGNQTLCGPTKDYTGNYKSGNIGAQVK